MEIVYPTFNKSMEQRTESGNTISHTQKITVNDTTAPTTTTVFTPSINVIVMRFLLNLDLYLWIIALLFLLLFLQRI
jgi:hypothetical protein